MKYFNSIKIKVLLAFFYINFTFVFKKIGTIQNIAIYAICIMYILINIQYMKRYLKIIKESYLKHSIIALIICITASLLIPTIYGTMDYSYIDTLTSIIRTSIKLFAILILFEKVHKDEANAELFSKYIVLSTVLYFMTTVLFLVIPNLKTIWNNIIDDSSYHIILENPNYITRYGICGFSGFQIAFKFAFAAIVNGYLIIKENVKIEKRNLDLYIVYLLILIGSTFYGRIGMVVSAVSLLYLLIVFIKKDMRKVMTVLAIVLTTIVVLTILYLKNETIRMWMDWALAPIINFIKTGKIYTGSSNIVFDKMIFMPNIRTLLLGDGYYTSPNIDGYYMSTDVGFMRPMLFYGIFFTIIAYLSIIIPIIKLILNSVKVKDKAKLFLANNFLIALIIIEIKGEIFYRLLPLVIIYIILFLMDGRSNSTENKINSM